MIENWCCWTQRLIKHIYIPRSKAGRKFTIQDGRIGRATSKHPKYTIPCRHGNKVCINNTGDSLSPLGTSGRIDNVDLASKLTIRLARKLYGGPCQLSWAKTWDAIRYHPRLNWAGDELDPFGQKGNPLESFKVERQSTVSIIEPDANCSVSNL